MTRSIRSRRSLPRLAPAFSIAAAAAFATLSAFAPSAAHASPPGGAQQPSPAAAPVRLVEVDSSGGRGVRRVGATVVSAQRATLATRIAAAVSDVRVQEGDRVKAGQVVIRLADQDLRGALAAAEAGLATATSHEKRIRTLLAQEASTPVELEQAVAQRAQAEAAVASARANLGYAEIRAPFAGTIQAKRVNAGDLVGPGQPLLDVEGSGGLEVQATVSETEAAALRVGARLPFIAGDRRGTTEIVALAPGGDPASHRVALRAHVVEGGEGLRSGAFVRLEVPSAGAAGAAVWIPRSALVERGDLTGVLVADDGRARLRWLSVGEVEGDRVAVRAGLQPGERIVDAPGALRDGAAITAERGVR